MNIHIKPLKIKIASPCSARWADMKGDQRTRFCEQCKLYVHDLSGMTAAEAATLLQEKAGRLCVRVYQRTDGTVLHGKDCPVGVARYRQRMRAFWGAGVSAVVLIFAHARAFAGAADEESRTHYGSAIQTARENFQLHLEGFGVDPAGPTMGDLVPVHMPPPTPAPTPIPRKPQQ